MAKAMQQIDFVLEYLYNKKDDKIPALLDTIRTDKSLLDMAGSSHELDRIINKLLDDKYVHRYPDYDATLPKLPNGKVDMTGGLLTYCPITFDGRLFWESGGYSKDLDRKKWREFPKKYWLAVAIFAFFIGFFGDIIKEALKQKLLPLSSKEAPILPINADSPQNHKIRLDISQSPLSDSLIALDSTHKKE